jgi:hypothetical protein
LSSDIPYNRQYLLVSLLVSGNHLGGQMATNKLTDIEVKQANTLQKDYKITDGGDLYLLVKNNGTKCWRLAYRFAGKQKTLAIGTYPQIGLKDARKQKKNSPKILIPPSIKNTKELNNSLPPPIRLKQLRATARLLCQEL